MANEDPFLPEEGFEPIGNVLARFRKVHTFIFDVDGVLTNSELLITEKGELLRKMNVRDGYAIKQALKNDYRILILTGGSSQGVISRLKDLGIQDILWGIHNKLGAYEEFLDAYDIDEDGILYMGDDMPDYEVMKRVGFPCCPADADPEIRNIAQYVSPYKGGYGCVRDVIEKVLRLRGQWIAND
ncbi:MAG: HAD-IIIA family hydrolase [Saprospiraceae bacterium]